MGSISAAFAAVGTWASSAGGAATISAVAAVGGATVAAVGQREAGIAAADDAKMRARQAGLEAGDKSIQIRQNMLKALASQNAAAGVGGIGTGGSFGANVNRQITQNQNDLLALSANTAAQEQQYNAQASNAVTTGNLKAGTSLLDSIPSLGKLIPAGGGGAPAQVIT